MFPIIVSGMILGSIYALMSMGLTMIWGGLRVLNLTQGALFMLGAYTGLVLGQIGMPPIIGLAGAFLAMGLLGLLLYVGPLRLLLNRPDRENATLLATIGLATVFENVALRVFGARNQVVSMLVEGEIRLANNVITWNSIVMTVLALALLLAVGTGLKWTRFGMSVRALAQQREGAQLSGINMDKTYAIVVALSSGVAGIGRYNRKLWIAGNEKAAYPSGWRNPRPAGCRRKDTLCWSVPQLMKKEQRRKCA